MSIRFEDIEFQPDTEALFCEMVEATLAATKSAGRLFLLAKHMTVTASFSSALRGGTGSDVDEGALNDLSAYGLLQLDYGSGGTPNYRVSNDGHRYYGYLQQARGTPMSQVEQTVRRFVDGEEFARQYPKAASLLNTAIALLWRGDTDDQTVSDIGAALRGSLQDFTDEYLRLLRVESEVSRERPIQRLQQVVEALAGQMGGPRASGT